MAANPEETCFRTTVDTVDTDWDSELDPTPATRGVMEHRQALDDVLGASEVKPPKSAPNLFREAQQAFGTLLLATKDKRRAPEEPTATSAPTQPTGPFRFLDLPRELRDRCYYFSIECPREIVYLQMDRAKGPDGTVYKNQGNYRREAPSYRPNTHLALYLTSRQIYEEALHAFCQWNSIRISHGGGHHARLDHSLRFFPDKPAAFVQRVTMTFYTFNAPTLTWNETLIDARKAKEYFPNLREFVAIWSLSGKEFINEDALPLERMGHDNLTQLLLDWMREGYRVNKLAPPWWLKVLLDYYRQWRDDSLEKQNALQASFSAALDRFRRELGGDEALEAELESSGRKWLEETWGEDSKQMRRKKRRSKQATT